MTYQSIYVPKSLDQAKEIATLLDDKPHDLLKCHASFGHHFNGDMGLVSTQSFCLRGKPSLNADAMAGIVRASGLCRFMKISTWDLQHCTMIFARTDEPKDIIHEFTYTFDMAKAQGLTNNRNWRQMPFQMLRSRVLTMGLRAVYPDAVSGIYSADEIADNTNISDDERAKISAESLGEELNLSQRPQPIKQASDRPQPKTAPQPTNQEEAKPKKKAKLKASPVWTFTNEQDFYDVCEEYGIPINEVNQATSRQQVELVDMSPEELESFFYNVVIHNISRKSWSFDIDWFKADQEKVQAVHEGFVAEYPILDTASPSWYGPRLAYGGFVEALRQANSMEEKHRSEATRLLSQMDPKDYAVYYKLLTMSNT